MELKVLVPHLLTAALLLFHHHRPWVLIRSIRLIIDQTRPTR